MKEKLIKMEPIWFRWVYDGKLIEGAPENVKKAYEAYLKNRKK